MKIALNALGWNPNQPGGDGTYIRQLVRRLPIAGPDDEWLMLVTETVRRLLPEQPANVRLVTCRLPGSSIAVRVIWEQLVAGRLINILRPDVLHCPMNVSPSWCSIPTVLTLHEAEPFRPGSGIPRPLIAWWRLARSRSARVARRLVTVSQAAREEIATYMGIDPKRIAVVPLGVDAQVFSPGQGSHLAQPFVLWVGRPYPSKNVTTLVRAFATVSRSIPELRLILAGPHGWDDAAIRTTIDVLGCRHRIRRYGPVLNDLPSWYRSCTLYCCPSWRETFGLPMLEALACGTPVVASNIRALREVGGDVPTFASPASVDSFAESMELALTDTRTRERAARHGPDRARAFSWDRTATEMYRQYQRALA